MLLQIWIRLKEEEYEPQHAEPTDRGMTYCTTNSPLSRSVEISAAVRGDGIDSSDMRGRGSSHSVVARADRLMLTGNIE